MLSSRNGTIFYAFSSGPIPPKRYQEREETMAITMTSGTKTEDILSTNFCMGTKKTKIMFRCLVLYVIV